MQEPVWPIILLVDDDPAHRLLAKRAICRAFPGAQIIESTNTKDALGKTGSRPNRIDLAVIDFNLGMESGVDLVKHIRKSAPIQELPVIIVSTSSLPDDVAKSYQAGSSCFIVKDHDASCYQISLTHALSFFLKPH